MLCRNFSPCSPAGTSTAAATASFHDMPDGNFETRSGAERGAANRFGIYCCFLLLTRETGGFMSRYSSSHNPWKNSENEIPK